MFDTLLIANRGEIACRVIRTARRMGLRTVAVYSEADAGALHATLADVAVPIGPAPARDSYLDITRIIAACRASGAQAVHPGYGFLSENAAFAEACAAAGITFVGPPPAAIRAMGSKSAAKTAMARAGVPLVPGYHGEDQDPALLAREAGRLGYPVLIKASAGGGGKGMRVVDTPEAFAEALALAQGEAASAFGDDRVLIERYLARPRHIEIQVFADKAGKVVSLFERDCSIQRRHQKIVEEAPAPGMSEARRTAMGDAACNAARAIGYVGAGTVEFIVEGQAFYFMEMNTRLQVEHPVTEMITGLDLVEWQIRVAAGGDLPSTAPTHRGHAIEVRLYAEDPARGFMPSTGRIDHLRVPEQGRNLRLDTGVRENDAVTVHYDPMLAKLIVWDETREAALRQLRRALAQTEIAGLRTNLPLLRRIAAHPGFAAGGVDTGFIPRHEAELLPPPEPAPPEAILAAAANALAQPPAQAAADRFSPWSAAGPWRMNADPQRTILVQDEDALHEVTARHHGAAATLRHAGATAELSGARLTVDGRPLPHRVIGPPNDPTVLLAGEAWPLHLPDPLAPPEAAADSERRVLAPMPGRIVAVHAAPGQAVAKGDVLLVLEAMKVQMRLAAPRDGVVGAVNATQGMLVDEGAELVAYAEPVNASVTPAG